MSAKPRLPSEIESLFPSEIRHVIYTFVPRSPKKQPPPPGLQRALEKLQKSPKRTAMDMYGLDDFVLC